MKRKISKMVFSLCAAFVCSTLSSCFTSSPLFGTWSDNLGNKISFAEDYTYVATITDTIDYNEENEPFFEDMMISGTFSVAENVISISTDYGLFVTEWDIRGSILYLDWTMPDSAQGERVRNLRLYHN